MEEKRVSLNIQKSFNIGEHLDLSELIRVSIGWQIGEVYHEQIGLCHDEKMFSTIWSNYTLLGDSIDFR